MELFRMAKPITKKSPASSPEDTVICDNCGFPIPKSQANKCSRCGAVLCDVCMAWHECEEHGTAEREPVKKTAGSKINHPAAVAGLLLLLLVLMAFIFGGYFMAINSMYPDFLKKIDPKIELNTSASGYVNSTHTFQAGDFNITINASVDAQVYYGAVDSELILGYQTLEFVNQTTNNVTHEFGYLNDAYLYPRLLNDPLQEDFYQNLLKQFRAVKAEYNLTDDEYVELLTSYVQSLPYDFDTVERMKVRYPVATAIEKTGDCDETSMLLAGLLQREGYDVGLLQLCVFTVDGEKTGHLMAAVRTNDDENRGDGTNYVYLETTSNYLPYYGNASSMFNSNVTEVILNFIKVGNGTKTYDAGAELKEMWDYLIKRKAELNISSDESYLISEDRVIKPDENYSGAPLNAFDRGYIYAVISERLRGQNV